jgi:hypothetical protein
MPGQRTISDEPEGDMPAVRHVFLSLRLNLRGVIHLLLGVALATPPLAAQQSLSHTERRVRQAVAKGVEDQIGYLQRIVDRPSSTLDLEGVRAVGAVFARSLDSLGFETRWADMPSEMRRAGHLIAEHRGKEGMARLLLIGHLDTVVDPGGATFARRTSVATGIGATDMKGGDALVLYALKALAAAGALGDLNLTVVFTGDEEQVGTPLELSRGALIDASPSASSPAIGATSPSRAGASRAGASPPRAPRATRRVSSGRAPGTARSTSWRGSSTNSGGNWPARGISASTSRACSAAPTLRTTASPSAAAPGAS